MKVFILVTGSSRASHLVFDTIRVGFPTFEIYVTHNVLIEEHGNDYRTQELARAVNASSFIISYGFKHWEWIRYLVRNEKDPFIICDTDIIFFDNMEDCVTFKGGSLAGEYVPRFFNPITKCETVPRLHTALMMINPKPILELEKSQNVSNVPTIAPIDLISPYWSLTRNLLYHDTMSNAYAVMMSHHLLDKERDKYVHLHCGTWLEHAKKVNEKFYTMLKEQQDLLMNDPVKYAPSYREQLYNFFNKGGSFSWQDIS